MKKTVFSFGLICATSVALSVSALPQSGSESSNAGNAEITGPTAPAAPRNLRIVSSDDAGSNWSSGQLSATGRSGGYNQQAVRGSRLMGSEVSDSSGNRIGRIEDVILNTRSGKIDFAVIARSGQGGSSSPSGSKSGYNSGGSIEQSGTSRGGYETSQSGTSSEVRSTSGPSSKLVPVPWSLLQPASSSPSAGPSSAAASLGSGQQSFTLTVDSSKLDSAPSLNRSSWSEISQSGWSQRINSYYGVSDSTPSDSSTGGSESPSGSKVSGAGSSESPKGPSESPGGTSP